MSDSATVEFFLKIEIQPLTAGLKTRLRNPPQDPSRTSATSTTKKEIHARRIPKKFIRFRGGTVLPLVLYSTRGKYGTALGQENQRPVCVRLNGWTDSMWE